MGTSKEGPTPWNYRREGSTHESMGDDEHARGGCCAGCHLAARLCRRGRLASLERRAQTREARRAARQAPRRESSFAPACASASVSLSSRTAVLFTDEARLPGARMGHRHSIEPAPEGGSRLTNTIYIDGPLAGLWRRILGPAAARTLPGAQREIVALASGVGSNGTLAAARLPRTSAPSNSSRSSGPLSLRQP